MSGLRKREAVKRERGNDPLSGAHPDDRSREEIVAEAVKNKGKKKPDLTYEGGGREIKVTGKSETTFVPPDQQGKWPGEAE